jgi:predicted HAD superfamily phosphohydrolase YqeG
MKPFSCGIKKTLKKYNLSNNEIIIIGDQLMTDILLGNFNKIDSVLVDPLGKKDLKITNFNRFLEKKVLKRLKKKGLFEKGIYYE